MLAVIALILVTALVFATTLINVPYSSPLPLDIERHSPLPLRAQVSRLSHKLKRLLHGPVAANTHPAKPLTIAFYTSWTDESTPSLSRHIDQIDWVAPTLLGVGKDGKLVETPDAPLRQAVAGSLHRPLVVPVVQNVIGSVWDGESTAALLHDPARRQKLTVALGNYLDKTHDGGIIFDFENLPDRSLPDMRRLLGETRVAFAAKHRVVAVTMPIDNLAWTPRAFAPFADKLILMAYDEHWQGAQAGPIASADWFVDRVGKAVQGLPAGKAVIALGNYAYDWHDGHADALTVEEAWLEAHDSGTRPTFDPGSGNPGFSFDDDGKRHDVWMLDAATSWNQLQAIRRLGIGNVALWRLGSEDPGFWPALATWRKGGGQPDLSAISQQTNVDVEGQGEILRIDATPKSGRRTVSYMPESGLIDGETYQSLPTPYVVQRTGARDKLVALTFDDGPDPAWTPGILSILERYRVPASFFIIGENGLANRDLLRRMDDDGDEIGNHSYTHPNMAEEPASGIALELNATQRLIEAATGRATHLFRAPYFGDAEPTTADELMPALIAQQHGYTVVGLHVDPGDWKRPGTQAVIDRTIDEVEGATPDHSANVVLLHDGGGNREQTLEALPAIITRLQHDGYRFVTAGALAGLDRDQTMPKVEGADLAAVRADVAVFGLLAAITVGLNWTFFFAIGLGILRSITMTVLALIPGKRVPSHGSELFRPLVTVIIPAYNEERVIETSICRVLASDYDNMEVIVADDGSRDRTSAIVAEHFADESRVRLLTLANGGKASALNRALRPAKGSIIVALDADTQFERDTIGRLVRWFVDERIGAVAGNAKVGNRVNLVTRWQAVEYVTAQNIERRALTRFDAIMVVPGAVGAWRREALDAVGGYPEDTLAEDQDLTIAIQRAGWRIAYDEEAVAWTEAPETFAALAKQRFRWSFGTLQCLWKHRGILRRGRPSGLALVGMPQAWLFQIVFAVISPLIDFALLISILGTALRVREHGWAQTQTDVLRMGIYWLGFTAIDLLCGWVAYRLDVRKQKFAPLLLLGQRFAYRQLMYGVVIRAVGAALAGLGIGWGKLERTGRAVTIAG
jgi:cellulose synthase/poly-beta-1,6-N-acetylglucosamine synthase-like glycosyltransferase/peptidoglycan/xylan/chitin deacetylase (PgdA/CDA1 family)/spore germination protein YaaH